MKALSEQEVTKFLKLNLKDWSFEKKAITRNFKFKPLGVMFIIASASL